MKLITGFFFFSEREKIVCSLLIRWLFKLGRAVGQHPHPNVIHYFEGHQEWWQYLMTLLAGSGCSDQRRTQK